MDQSKITVRYAKAFFSLGKEKGQLEELRKDIELIYTICTESADFKLLLESPVVKTSQKLKLMSSIFEGKIQELSLNFLQLITENRREIHLAGICRNILSLYKLDQDVRTVVMTSAVSLSPGIIDQIKSQLQEEFKATIELSEQVDPSLIGGFILRVDDKQVDASIATQLKKVKDNLLQSEIK